LVDHDRGRRALAGSDPPRGQRCLAARGADLKLLTTDVDAPPVALNFQRTEDPDAHSPAVPRWWTARDVSACIVARAALGFVANP
jgi:hypothetical protein